jgi:glycosyltransferase involved in cell wall biosynthesis
VNNWEYLSAVAEIMKNNPETVYLACGTGSEEEIKEKVEKLGIADRFYFEGFVDPHVYGYVIDIYLNTFPEPGGLSVLEFIKKAQHNENKFVVSLN